MFWKPLCRFVAAFAAATTLAMSAASAALMQAPPTFVNGQSVKVASGTTYTVDANLFVSVSAYQDFVSLLNMGFFPAWGGRNNFTATGDPGSTNDSSQDYAVGSLWANTSVNPTRWWINASAVIASAVWVQMTTGVNASNAGSANFINLVLSSGLLTESAATGVTAFNGGGQSSATSMTAMVNNVTTSVASSTPYDSVKFTTGVAGNDQCVWNTSANPIQLFGTGSDKINGFTSTTGITLQAGQYYCGHFVGTNNWQGSNPGMGFATDYTYNTNTATSGATLTGANVAGASIEVDLNMTGTMSGDSNLQMPTVANLLAVAAIPNPTTGYSYKLRVINSSSANHTWTITTDTGWTLNGTMTVGQNTWRDFILTITSVGSATATLQSVGTGTNS